MRDAVQVEDSDFKRMISKPLLGLQATNEEYSNFADELYTKILESNQATSSTNAKADREIELTSILDEWGQELTSKPLKPIDILKSFEPLPAVRLFRKTLHLRIVKAYKELAEKSIITEGLSDFLSFDNYLSPLTAHPANSVVKILFSNPFERIYEDAYLLDKDEYSPDRDAFWVFSGRAYAIYNNFSDFLFELFKYDFLSREERAIITEEMIFSWNVASTRFDLVCNFLSKLLEKKRGSGNYHLKCNDLNFNVIDLADKKQLLPLNISSGLLVFGSTPTVFAPLKPKSKRLYPKIMMNPFTSLRPCLTFQDMEWKYEFIPIEKIFSDLESKIEIHEGKDDHMA